MACRGRADTRCFGEDTAGVPTGNAQHRLPDGAILNLTEARDADPTRRAYDSPIPPDQPSSTTSGAEEARIPSWTRQRNGCPSSPDASEREHRSTRHTRATRGETHPFVDRIVNHCPWSTP
nr:hypothetical protein [Streptomyces tirandamycinicus]